MRITPILGAQAEHSKARERSDGAPFDPATISDDGNGFSAAEGEKMPAGPCRDSRDV
jgi:hypothetical protein